MQYGPKIVTDSLVLALDAADNNSAPHNDLPVKQGLVGWWDANDDSTVTLSGSNVTQWRDKSGNSNHMSVPSSYSGPTRGNTLNSKKVLTFTQSNGLESTLNLSSSNYTVLGVSRYTATGQTPSTSPSSGRVIQANSNNWLLGHHNAGTQRHYAVGWVTSAGTDDTNWRIYSGTGDISGDVYKFYVVGTDNTQNSGAGSAGPNGLGINTGYSEHSACEGAEIIAFNRVLSDDERTKVHNYLQNKWNIPVSDARWYDQTANAYNGTLLNNPVHSSSEKGVFEFDGTSSIARLGDLTFMDNAVFSLEVVFECFGSTGATQILINKSRYPDRSVEFYVRSTGQIRFGLYNGSWKYLGDTYGYTTAISYNQYYHMVATSNGANTALYVNGTLVDSRSDSHTSLNNSSDPVEIGAYNASPTSGFNGNIALVRGYSKALSATEVLQNYNAAKARFNL